MKRRFIEDQGGFTLAEVMVTMMVMLIVLFALYSIFDMSLKVFRFGNDKVEAVENARLGLEKMEREIRAAYPVNGPTGDPRYRFFNANGANPPSPPNSLNQNVGAWTTPTRTQITFGNELGSPGDGVIRCGNPCEYITYKLTASNSGAACTVAPCTLRRVNAADFSTTGDAVVEYVALNGLQFRYFTESGTEIDPASPGSYTQADIARVEISLTITKNGRTQDLKTEVDLRNPGSI